MKKFIFMVMLTLSMVSYAQVHEGKFLDNTYATLSVGGILPTTDFQVGTTEFRKNWRPEFGLEVGKQITTLYGMGIEFTSAVNTTGAKTAFDELSLLWLHKINVTNMFRSYNPESKWDVNLVGGLGWGHEMVVRNNYGVAQAGIEVAYNLNNTWSVLAKPNIEWAYANEGLNVNNSEVGLSVGVSYRFPNRHRGRGFELCDRNYIINECIRLNAQINELREESERIIKNQNSEINCLKNQPKEVDTVYIDNTINPTIGFVINSAELTPSSNAYLYQIAKSYKSFVVRGYADAQTGNPKYNMELSKKRAEAVKTKLEEFGATNITVEAYGDTVQPFSENDMNRTVIVIKQ